jgi:DNA-binding NtrC family response regulator
LITDTSTDTVQVLVIDAGEALPMYRSVEMRQVERFRMTQKQTLSQGLEALRKSSFDVVLLSLSLPDASMPESVTKTLKMAHELPVVALVDEGKTSKAADALRLGMHDYVFKGCRCDSLTRTIRHAVERKKLIAERDEARRQAAESGPPFTSQVSHDLRNSFAAIQQFGNILLDGLAGELSGEQREYLGIMMESSTKVRKLLDGPLNPTPAPRENSTAKIGSFSRLEN